MKRTAKALELQHRLEASALRINAVSAELPADTHPEVLCCRAFGYVSGNGAPKAPRFKRIWAPTHQTTTVYGALCAVSGSGDLIPRFSGNDWLLVDRAWPE